MKDTLNHVPTGATARVGRLFGHHMVIWNPFIGYMYTKADLPRLHHRFGHPHVEKLMNLLKRADSEKLNLKTRRQLEKKC